MGGDAAPGIVVDGAALALEQDPDLRFLLFGDAPRLEPLLASARAACAAAIDGAPHAGFGRRRRQAVAWRCARAATPACGSPSTR